MTGTLTPATPALAPAATPDRLIDFSEMRETLGVTERTLRRWLKERRVPDPIRLGSRRLRWRWSTVAKFLADLESIGGLGA
jgi:predicted DNA-binding transcriptional regulator AlpA